MIQKANSNYTRALLSGNSRNPDGFLGSNKTCISFEGKKRKIRKIANGIKSTKSDFCNYFSTAVSTLKQISVSLIDFTWRKPQYLPLSTDKSFHLGYASVIEVTRLLKKLKRKKATENDDLLPDLLIDSAAVISAPLTHITNLSFRSGVFPFDWKIAKILLLYAIDQFGNYCPVSILPVIYEIVEKIVHNQLVDYPSESKLLPKRKFGFRAKRSTVTLLCDDIYKNLDFKLPMGSVFIDFSKAFYTISHAKLLKKLNAYRIRNVESEWFSDYLFNHNQLFNFNKPCPNQT